MKWDRCLEEEANASSNRCCNALSMWSTQAINFPVTSATSKPARARRLGSGVHKKLLDGPGEMPSVQHSFPHFLHSCFLEP